MEVSCLVCDARVGLQVHVEDRLQRGGGDKAADCDLQLRLRRVAFGHLHEARRHERELLLLGLRALPERQEAGQVDALLSGQLKRLVALGEHVQRCARILLALQRLLTLHLLQCAVQHHHHLLVVGGVQRCVLVVHGGVLVVHWRALAAHWRVLAELWRATVHEAVHVGLDEASAAVRELRGHGRYGLQPQGR